MKCKICGTEFNPGMGYCPVCGSTVQPSGSSGKEDPAYAAEPVRSPSMEQPVYEQNITPFREPSFYPGQYEQPVQEKKDEPLLILPDYEHLKEKPKKKVWPIVLILVLIAAGLGVGAYFLFRDKGENGEIPMDGNSSDISSVPYPVSEEEKRELRSAAEYAASLKAKADESLIDYDVYDDATFHAFEKGSLMVTARPGQMFGATEKDRNVESLAKYMNKAFAETKSFPGSWGGMTPAAWGIFMDKDLKTKIYAIAEPFDASKDDPIYGYELAPNLGDAWQIIDEDDFHNPQDLDVNVVNVDNIRFNLVMSFSIDEYMNEMKAYAGNGGEVIIISGPCGGHFGDAGYPGDPKLVEMANECLPDGVIPEITSDYAGERPTGIAYTYNPKYNSFKSYVIVGDSTSGVQGLLFTPDNLATEWKELNGDPPEVKSSEVKSSEKETTTEK